MGASRQHPYMNITWGPSTLTLSHSACPAHPTAQLRTPHPFIPPLPTPAPPKPALSPLPGKPVPFPPSPHRFSARLLPFPASKSPQFYSSPYNLTFIQQPDDPMKSDRINHTTPRRKFTCPPLAHESSLTQTALCPPLTGYSPPFLKQDKLIPPSPITLLECPSLSFQGLILVIQNLAQGTTDHSTSPPEHRGCSLSGKQSLGRRLECSVHEGALWGPAAKEQGGQGRLDDSWTGPRCPDSG